MRRDFILGTAGHIDHGKTALIKALTGTDCDRLPEEKVRGITIDIGFARLDLGDVQVGVVDVPGHDRFVHNMLAGTTGIDAALLVVAAGESVMPQTREHADILRLLGIPRGVVAITKCDLVDPDRLAAVRDDVAELLRGSPLEAARVVLTSAVTGQGLDELRDAIRDVCLDESFGDLPAPFRLPIDRAFVVQGHGTVVTGSVVAGTVRVGDEVDWHRGDGTTERVRVRGLNNHGRPVDEVSLGQRAALNLAGVPHTAIARGQELAAPGTLVPSRVLTLQLHALPSNARPIRHRQPVRVHLHANEVMARVAVLDALEIPPGGSALVQLLLDEAVVAVWGQPVIVRDAAAERTLGGGGVLQPTAPRYRRRNIEALQEIERLQWIGLEDRILVVAWLAGFSGIRLTDLWRLAGLPSGFAEPLVGKLLAAGNLVEAGRALHQSSRVADVEGRIMEALAARHAENPLATAHERQSVFARLAFVDNEPLLHAVTDQLLARKLLVGNHRVARADFKPRLTAAQRKLKDRIVEDLLAARYQPAEPATYLPKANGNAALLQDIYKVAVAEGLAVHVAGSLYLHAEAEAEMRCRVAEFLAGRAGATVAEIKELLGTSRKFAVPLCEYLDRVGVTRRDGDLRAPAKS